MAGPKARRQLGPRVPDGRVTPHAPDVMWGIDATSTLTRLGLVSVLFAVDHCTGEWVGVHVAPKGGRRYDALEVVRQGVRARFAGFDRDVAKGLSLRHDHGTQFTSDAFQAELPFLGVESSPSFVRAPEGNGVAQRFARTMKEHCLWLHAFDDLEHVRRVLSAWVDLYNEHWLVARHGYRTPAQVRRDLVSAVGGEAA